MHPSGDTAHGRKPLLSFVVISYDMVREVPRTVRSCLPPYQRGALPGDIEVIVVENGSSDPIPADIHKAWPDAVRYVHMPDPRPSPAAALNYGARLARAPYICPVIDGARILSSGIFEAFQDVRHLAPYPVIATLGYHLGKVPQQFNPDHTPVVEDALLAHINWAHAPHRLFEISCLGGSSSAGLLANPAESNAVIIDSRFYGLIGGYDEAFATPGGGFVNLDFFKRCIEHPLATYFLLIGEGTFHQVHGGASTTHDPKIKPGDSRPIIQDWAVDYEGIRGEPFKESLRKPILYGEAADALLAATESAVLVKHGHKSRY